MDDKLDQNYINFLVDGELGENMLHLVNYIDVMPPNKILIDLGVETGKSSKVLLHKALEKNNRVFGIDPIPSVTIPGILTHPKYTFIPKDSVSTGRDWPHGKVDVVFVDSIHAKEQVMMELYYWWDLLNEGGWVVFHDTAWQNYIHKPNHPCAGKKPGNTGLGYDFYQGRAWQTPDYAVKEFFKIDSLNYEDQYIKSMHYPTSLGMTYINKKKHFDYKSLTPNWEEIEANRQILLKSFI
jgi:hypothetical protein